MSISRRQTVHIDPVEAFALETFVKIIFISIQMLRVRRVHDFQFAVGIAHSSVFELGFNVVLAANN